MTEENRKVEHVCHSKSVRSCWISCFLFSKNKTEYVMVNNLFSSIRTVCNPYL